MLPLIVMFAAFLPIVGLIVWVCKTGRYDRNDWPGNEEIGPPL